MDICRIHISQLKRDENALALILSSGFPASELEHGGFIPIVTLLRVVGFADSNSEAKRKARERAVRLYGVTPLRAWTAQDSKPITIINDDESVWVEDGSIIQLGKRRFAKIELASD